MFDYYYFFSSTKMASMSTTRGDYCHLGALHVGLCVLPSVYVVNVQFP